MNLLELEKSLFKVEFMNDLNYLDSIIDDDFIECGKIGLFFDKKVTVEELSKLDSDRDIKIYNFTSELIDTNSYLVHYITKSGDDLIYRTSIWKNGKLYFHQASKLNIEIELIEY